MSLTLSSTMEIKMPMTGDTGLQIQRYGDYVSLLHYGQRNEKKRIPVILLSFFTVNAALTGWKTDLIMRLSTTFQNRRPVEGKN